MDKKSKTNRNIEIYPPVVAVVGHVDHGKTTLLDTIRKTSVASREHGGITQKIGASEIEVKHEDKKRKITFIDTPGHEAFGKMRGRGVAAADIGLLVVSSVDGVMPQTIESIKLLKESKIPYIVVFTKIDDPKKIVDKAIDQLLKQEVMLENYGGDVPFIEVSAKENLNIDKLLDLILLVFDVKKDANFYPFTKNGPFLGIVIESRLDKNSGPRATLVIKNGILKLKDEIFSTNTKGKVKNMLSWDGKSLQEASVGEAVEVLGFEQVPEVGSTISTTPKQEAKLEYKEANVASLSPFENEDKTMLSLVLVADNKGSLEAITNSLASDIKIATQKTGEIEASDILFAKSTGAIVIGFNIKVKPEVLNLARTEKVIVKTYTIIYEMIDEIKDFLAGKIEALQEEILGIAKILAEFPYEKTKVLGIKVQEGRIAKGDKIRLLRNDETIGETRITSVRKGKEETSKIEEGQEGGVLISPFLDFTIGDMIISHN